MVCKHSNLPQKSNILIPTLHINILKKECHPLYSDHIGGILT